MSVIINVARKRQGNRPPRHVFRTARDSVNSKADAVEIARKLSSIYPPEEYEITVGVEMTYSEYIDWEDPA